MQTTDLAASRNSCVLVLSPSACGNRVYNTLNIVDVFSDGKPPFDADIYIKIKLFFSANVRYSHIATRTDHELT